MARFKTTHSTIPVFLLLFLSSVRGMIVRDRLDYRRMNLSSIPREYMTDIEAKYVTKVVFSHNAIEYLTQSDFERLRMFPNIRYLFLDNNKIRNIYEEGFSTLNDLRHLDLSHNQLTSITDELRNDLLKLTMLEYINLKRNPIENFANIHELLESGIDVDYDGMAGVNRLKRQNDDHEILDHMNHTNHTFENKTSTDKPRKAFVVDNKPILNGNGNNVGTPMEEKFLNSIIFNFVAAGLVLLALPMGMIIYYMINKNKPTYL